MGDEEKDVGRAIMEAVAILPDEKREYLLGYAEGVIAMANHMRAGVAMAQEPA